MGVGARLCAPTGCGGWAHAVRPYGVRAGARVVRPYGVRGWAHAVRPYGVRAGARVVRPGAVRGLGARCAPLRDMGFAVLVFWVLCAGSAWVCGPAGCGVCDFWFFEFYGPGARVVWAGVVQGLGDFSGRVGGGLGCRVGRRRRRRSLVRLGLGLRRGI